MSRNLKKIEWRCKEKMDKKKHAQSARDTAPWERLPSMLEVLSLMHSTAEDKRGKEGWGWQRQSGDGGAGGKY